MSTPVSDASKSRSNASSKMILLDDDDEPVLRPTPRTNENALSRPSHENRQEDAQEEDNGERGGELEQLLAVEDCEDSDSDDDEDDVEEYLEDILHTLLETEGATEQDGILLCAEFVMQDIILRTCSAPTTLPNLQPRRNHKLPRTPPDTRHKQIH